MARDKAGGIRGQKYSRPAQFVQFPKPLHRSAQQEFPATLGPIERVPAAARRTSAWIASQPVLMWATMAMAMLALAGLLWRMSRGVRYTQEGS